MDLEIILKLLFLIFLLCLSAFLSGSETALFSLSSVRVHRMLEEKRKGAHLLPILLKEPKNILATILLANLFVNVFSTSLGEEISATLFGEQGLQICILVMSFVILIFCEIVPKVLSVSKSEKISLRVAPGLYFFMKVLTPFRALFMIIADRIIRSLTFKEQPEKKITPDSDQLKTALRMGIQEGLLNSEEASMIKEIIAMKTKKVSEMMIPREKIFALEIATPLPQIYDQIRKRKFSRIPIFKGDLDHIVGILYAKDLIMQEITEFTVIQIYDLLRPPYLVSDQMKLDQLFYILKTERSHLALLKNGQGHIVGLITLDDFIEGIVVDSLDFSSPVSPMEEAGK